jgi:tetratricopeptide (TPR) repeat protein
MGVIAIVLNAAVCGRVHRMVLPGKRGLRMLLLLAWAWIPVATATAQDVFAVIQVANATDDVTIQYRFRWGDHNQEYTLKPRSRLFQYDRQQADNQNSSSVPQIEFTPRVNGPKKSYRLRASASSRTDSGGNTYVFEKQVDSRGEVYIDLVELGVFIEYNNRLVARLLGQKDFNNALERCDRAVEIAWTDASTFNFRGRANYLLNRYDEAIDDFTRAISLDPKQAMYHSNRGYSHIGVKRYDKALADFEVAIQFDPGLPNSYRGRELAKTELDRAGAVNAGASGGERVSAPILEETRLDKSRPARERFSLPKEFEPYISHEAYEALERFRLGSKVDADENGRLQVAYDRAYEEGRYIDAQEANFIRAIEREPVAALWKILNDPDGNNYYLPKFTPVEERLDGFKRPLVGKGSDKMTYLKSDDDLAGLRIAIRRPPQDPRDGGLETAAIIPFRWVKGSGIVPLDPPDNLRVLIQLKKEGEHAMLGMSFSLTTAADGSWDLRPEIYTSPKFGDDRFKAASSTVVSPRGCMDCHALGFNIKASKFVGPSRGGDTEFAAAIKEMPGLEGFVGDARKQGASVEEIKLAESIVTRPDVHILAQRKLRIAVIKLWNAIYYANQPYLDDADGRFVDYHARYGLAWLEAGEFERALEHLTKAISRGPEVPSPKIATAFFARAEVGWLTGDYRRSLADADEAIRLQPQFAAAHNLRAKLLATAPAPDLRNGAQAVDAATRACELSGWKTLEFVDTLAAAYAESANFTEAVKWQETALAAPGRMGNSGDGAIKAARNRLELYRKNLPFHDALPTQKSNQPG